MPDLALLQQTLRICLKDTSLLEQALVHSSYINENPGYHSGHNERLEFLGDAILNFIVTSRLYREFPSLSEGEMTRLRAVLVRGDTLAKVARAIRLGDYLFMGRGEDASGGRDKMPNLAGALEAIIAAIYLDQGIEVAEVVVNRLLAEEWKRLTSYSVDMDYKTKLQELTQSLYRSVPVYRLLSETGPAHARLFQVEVVIENKVLGTGSGRSKKQAEAEAASMALKRLGDFTERISSGKLHQ